MSTSYQHDDIDGMGLAKDYKLQLEIDQQNRDFAINRAMAEVAGRKLKYDTRWWVEIVEGVWGLTEDDLPYYVEDLNAVHEIEVSLPIMQLARYRGHLACQFTDHPDDGIIHAVTATARQRCTAILKTLSKWNPEWDR